MLRSRGSRKTQAINNGKGEGDRSRVYVKYVSGGEGAVANALSAAGGKVHYAFDALNAFAVSVPTAALDGLSHNPNILLVEEDPVRSLTSIIPSTSAALPSPQRRAASTGQTVPYGVDIVQARDVWDSNRDGSVDAGAPTGSNRKVCIIDTGFLVSHEDLQGVSVTGYNGNLPWNEDGDGHGTHVAGTIVAVNNNLGVVGVTPGTVNVYIVRVFGNDGGWAYSSDLVDATNRCAVAGANIISMSLGGSFSSPTERTAFDALLNQKGILSIAAAGNSGDGTNSYPASYSSVMSVAAVDSGKVVATFSTRNAGVDLCAPGVGVLSTTISNKFVGVLTVANTTYAGSYIDGAAKVSASGELVYGGLCNSSGTWSGKVVLCQQRGSITFFDKVQNVLAGGGVAAVIYNNVAGVFYGSLSGSAIPAVGLGKVDGEYLVANNLGTPSVLSFVANYAFFDGTSMATPHVSAVAALVWSAKPTATNLDVRAALIATAEDLGMPGRDDLYGYGLVQAKRAMDYLLFSPSIQVGALSATKTISGTKWSATITIKVVDANNAIVSGALVTGAWSGAKTGTATCTTAPSGTCNVVASNMSGSTLTFTIQNLAKTGYSYNAGGNVITITKK
ncbi:hypothetical protein ACHAW5_000968 [Stephanodiscus triporus]|uniref:subtilisin n=1 Tax=Stephanodiscus triporus TaxID=2934178 RepID=A0ABD3QT63_9STRA